jgi:Ca2+-binding RTX toxin-like protein
VGNHLVLKINDPGNPSATDQITIENWNSGAYRIETLQFADGSVLSAAQLSGIAMTGTVNADILTVWSDGSFADGREGNDTILAASGSQTIDGGAGDDIITDQGAGTNVLRGGDGNDTLNFSYIASNTIDGGNGNDLIKMDSPLYSDGRFVNTLSGGTGNDRLEAGCGADTYLFSRGDGQDTINDYGYCAYGYAVGQDKIVFGAGITAGDLSAVRVGNHLVMKINGPGNPGATDQITIEGWFTSGTYQIENFAFNNGTSLTASALLAQLPVQSIGTTAIDTLSGYDGTDHMDGKDGYDTLLAYAGNDRLNGNLGNDTLTGGAGNDTFVFDSALNAATNKDTIVDFTLGQDKIELSRSIFSAVPGEGTLASLSYLASPTGAAADENDYILYNTTSGALLYDADGNGQGVAIEFATLTNKPAIKAEDFMIVA